MPAQPPVPVTPGQDPALAALEARFAGERAVALRRVLAKYVDELEVMEKSLLQAGDAAGAARVRLERDRVWPALGLPAVSAGDADEFAAFEDPGPVPAPAVLPPVLAAAGDLDSILKTLLPVTAPAAASVSPSAGLASPAALGTGKGAKRVLRMGNAQLQGPWDPAQGYYYWYSGRTASWTLNDLPPGTYHLVMRYACDEKDKGGGKLKVRFGSAEKREVQITGTGGWKRRREMTLGPFVIRESRADLLLEADPGGSFLFDLVALLVQPAGAVEKSGSP